MRQLRLGLAGALLVDHPAAPHHSPAAFDQRNHALLISVALGNGVDTTLYAWT